MRKTNKIIQNDMSFIILRKTAEQKNFILPDSKGKRISVLC